MNRRINSNIGSNTHLQNLLKAVLLKSSIVRDLLQILIHLDFNLFILQLLMHHYMWVIGQLIYLCFIKGASTYEFIIKLKVNCENRGRGEKQKKIELIIIITH